MVHRCVVMWLHILVGTCRCAYVALFGSSLLQNSAIFFRHNSYREKPNEMQQCTKLLFLILNEAQHVSDDTPPIIRSLKLHKQPLVLHNTLESCRTCSCWALSSSERYLTTSNNSTSDNLPRMQVQRLLVQF